MLNLAFSIAGIVAWSILVLIYQASMAFLARRLGIAVEQVSIGFGPTLWAWRRGAEEWRFKLIPFGGYTKFQNDSDDAPENGHHRPLPGSFEAAPPMSRLMVVALGPFTNMLAGVLLLGVAVWCGQNQMVYAPTDAAEMASAGSPGLFRDVKPSSWEGQLQLAAETSWYYFSRLITFRSLEGWGGPIAFIVTLGRVGADSWMNWITLIGLAALTNGCFNLLPLPTLNGFHILHIAVAGALGRRRLPERVIFPVTCLGLFVILVWFGRMVWLDYRWI